jgi:hypothetical protein
VLPPPQGKTPFSQTSFNCLTLSILKAFTKTDNGADLYGFFSLKLSILVYLSPKE